MQKAEKGLDPDSSQRTEVQAGPERVRRTLLGFFANTSTRLDIFAGLTPSVQSQQDEEVSREYFGVVKRGGRLRLITEITKENLGVCKGLMGRVEIRHLDQIGSYFGVSDGEYLALPGTQEFSTEGPLLYSNEATFVRHHQLLFDTLWSTAIPGDVRFAELEDGESIGETRLTFSTEEIFASANRFVDEMKEEALVILSREGSIKDNPEFFRKLAARAGASRASVRILGRFSAEEAGVVKELQLAGAQVRVMSPGRITNLSLGIYDRKGMGLVQYIFPGLQKRQAGETFLTGIVSTSRQVISGIAAIFDSLWEESELRQRAELMQDILVHDVRNYNQISRANLEIVRGHLTDRALLEHIDKALRSIDGSTELVQKTRMLADVIGDQATPLSAVDLRGSVERSLSLVGQVFSSKRVELSPSELPDARVMADQLLDQVFVNIISNAMKYTDGDAVRLQVLIEPDLLAGVSGGKAYWRVTVADQGRGIPDDLKGGSTIRYLGTEKGRGLGLSIAHALVTHRYAGRLELKNRVEGDHAKGTQVVVWLPRA